jgi:hypothetical protein
MNKLDLLKLHAFDHKPALIGITESWCYEEVLDSELEIANYALYRGDRCQGRRRGGGSLLYARNDFRSHCINNVAGVFKGFTEAAGCVLESYPSRRHLVLCVYRPPEIEQAENDRLNDLIANCGSHGFTDVLLFGDFNYPRMDWKSAVWPARYDCFMDAVMDASLTQHVTLPTHRAGNVLDLVFTSEEYAVKDVSINRGLAKSDHFGVYFKYDLRGVGKVSSSGCKWKNFGRADFVGMNAFFAENLQYEDWSSTLEAWDAIKGSIEEACNAFVPILSRRSQSKPAWADSVAWKAMKRQENAFRWFKRSGTGRALDGYTIASDIAASAIRCSVKKFELLLAENIKSDSKSFWKYINSKRRSKPSPGPLLKPDGSATESDLECANEFNSAFARIFKPDDNAAIAQPPTPCSSSFDEVDVSTEVISTHIRKLKRSSSPGPDKIMNILLINCCESLAAPLSKLFRLSLDEGVVPGDWKEALVVPIHKSGPRSDAFNFRPVSLTSSPCKLLESVICTQLICYLEENKLLNDSQHGFRSGRSCESQLVEFLNSVTACVDSGDFVDVVYADVRKAFDTVPHRKMLAKIQNTFGVQGKPLRWFERFLRGRSQSVVVNGMISDPVEVPSGVPQGSVCGPILFLMYVDDIDDSMSSRVLKFADDTKSVRRLHRSCPELGTEDLQADLDSMALWADTWGLEFNVAKFTSLHFGRGNPHHVYSINGEQIPQHSCQKDLGVVINESLGSEEQCTAAAKKANKVMGLIKRSFICLTPEIFLPLYISLVRPHLEYAITAWAPHYARDIKLLERVQARSTKAVFGLRELSYEERMRSLGIQSLATRRIRSDLIMTYKITHGAVKVPMDSVFSYSGSFTRGNSLKLKPVLWPKRDVRKYFFGNRVINMWNKLPDEVVTAPTLAQFKRNLHSSGILPEL